MSAILYNPRTQAELSYQHFTKKKKKSVNIKRNIWYNYRKSLATVQLHTAQQKRKIIQSCFAATFGQRSLPQLFAQFRVPVWDGDKGAEARRSRRSSSTAGQSKAAQLAPRRPTRKEAGTRPCQQRVLLPPTSSRGQPTDSPICANSSGHTVQQPCCVLHRCRRSQQRPRACRRGNTIHHARRSLPRAGPWAQTDPAGAYLHLSDLNGF